VINGQLNNVPSRLTPEQIATLPRISAPAVSPNGKRFVYTQYKYHMIENSTSNSLWMVEADSSAKVDGVASLESAGFSTWPLTSSLFSIMDNAVFWLNDETVGFLSLRSGHSQVWTVQAKQRHAQLSTTSVILSKQLTSFPVGITTVRYHRHAHLLAFSAQVYEDGGLKEAARLAANVHLKADSALVYDQLYVRHWDHYVGPKKQNLFVVRLMQTSYGYQLSGEPINLMVGSGLVGVRCII
jgi:dipeptidyl aminopeptidase/acylaminoacyl peptidase